MDLNMKIIQRLDRVFVFQGLSIDSIEHIREYGLWMPVTKDILAIDDRLAKESCQLYLEHPASGLFTLIIEYGEFLTGSVYDLIDQSVAPTDSAYLHQYTLAEGGSAKEYVQTVQKNIVFLELRDDGGNLLSDWDDAGIEYVLATQQ